MVGTRITEEVARYVAAAVEQHSAGETVGYDVSIAVVPTAPNQFQPALVLVVTIPDLSNLGSRLVGSGLMDMAVTESYVSQFVAQTLETLRGQRSAALRVVPKHTDNGNKPTWDDMEGMPFEDVEKKLRGE